MKELGHCTLCEKLVFDFTPSLKPLDDACEEVKTPLWS